jgi:hypothetical protein
MQAMQEAKDAAIRKEEEARGLNMTTKGTMGQGKIVLPVIKKAKGGLVKSSASRRADGAAKKGKTKGRTL